MMVSILLALAMLASLALAALCAGMETGFLSLNRGRVVHLAREGSKAAGAIASALSDMTRTIATLLIGNNVGTVVFSSASAALCARILADSSSAQAVWSFCAAMLMLYVGEFMPKLFASSRPLSRMLKVVPIYGVIAGVLSPISSVATFIIRKFMKKSEPKYKVSANELLRILQDRKDGVRLTDFESALISRILVLRKKGEQLTAESIFSAIDDDNEL